MGRFRFLPQTICPEEPHSRRRRHYPANANVRFNTVARSGCGAGMLATNIPSGDDRRPRPPKDRRILAALRCQCVLRSPHTCPALRRLSVPPALPLQRPVASAPVNDHQNWKATAPESSPRRSTSAAARHRFRYPVGSSKRGDRHWSRRTILASRWWALPRPYGG